MHQWPQRKGALLPVIPAALSLRLSISAWKYHSPDVCFKDVVLFWMLGTFLNSFPNWFSSGICKGSKNDGQDEHRYTKVGLMSATAWLGKWWRGSICSLTSEDLAGLEDMCVCRGAICLSVFSVASSQDDVSGHVEMGAGVLGLTEYF
jgi:hypothetical protein